MSLGEVQQMRGELTIKIVDTTSGEVIETRRVPNLITTAGKVLLANLLMGQIDKATHFNIAVGRGNTKASAADTSLAEEVAREHAEVKVNTAPPGTVKAEIKATFESLKPGASEQQLVEAGIVITADGKDTLFNRVIFGTVTRGQNMNLNLTWEISF